MSPNTINSHGNFWQTAEKHWMEVDWDGKQTQTEGVGVPRQILHYLYTGPCVRHFPRKAPRGQHPQAELDLITELYHSGGTKSKYPDYTREEQASIFNLLLRRIQGWHKLNGELKTDFGTGVKEWAMKQVYQEAPPTSYPNIHWRTV